MCHLPVCKTKEYLSSQTCPWCFLLTRLARGRRLHKGVHRLVRLHGAVECYNPGQDTNAAINVALAGFSLLF